MRPSPTAVKQALTMTRITSTFQRGPSSYPHRAPYPVILLLYRQIKSEALPVLYSTQLTLTGAPRTYIAIRQMDITGFISETLTSDNECCTPDRKAGKGSVLTLLNIWGRGCMLQWLAVCLPKGRMDEGIAMK
ncbi:hypothetical protein BDW72DRAFT_35486 [Aspergillus terricola var. indicus]